MSFLFGDIFLPLDILMVFLVIVSTFPIFRNAYFKTLPRILNKVFKSIDHTFSGGAAFKKNTWFSSVGHSSALSILVAFVLLFTLFGPSLSPVLGWAVADGMSMDKRLWGALTLLLYFFLLASLGFYSKRLGGDSLRFLHAGLVLVAAAFILFVVPASHKEADNLPYRHIYAALSGVLVLVGFVASWGVRQLSFGEFYSKVGVVRQKKYLMRRLLENGFDNSLDEQNLSSKHQGSYIDSNPEISMSRVLHSLLIVPFREPILLLLLPAIMIVVPIFQLNSEYKIFGALTLTWLVLANGMIFDQWNLMVTLLHRRFVQGGSFVISIIVIAIGICHLANISYIRTITDSDSWILLLYMFAGYVLVWLYDYWANWVLGTETLRFFRKASDKEEWRIRFTSSDGLNWILQLHGRSRFLVVNEDDSESPMKNPVIASEFLISLANKAPKSIRDSALSLADEINRLNKSHLIILNSIFTVAVIGTFGYLVSVPHKPLVQNVEKTMLIAPAHMENRVKTNCTLPEDKNRLACRIEKAGENGPVILLAASGGGTRAALYTASVLNGLQQQNLLSQVVLASGVSGGGVSLAYFVKNFNRLINSSPIDSCDLKNKNQDNPWLEFCFAMAESYIRDVIAGAGELRIVQGEPLGKLLAESLGRIFKDDTKFGDIKDAPALILNTTVAGHPRNVSESLYRQFCPDDLIGAHNPNVRDRSCDNLKDLNLSYTVHAGSRLVFTNLEGPVRHFKTASHSFPSIWSGRIPDAHLKYIVVNDKSVSLSDAAASTANFPAVFSNAGVEIKKGRPRDGVYPGTYWVTDGGAADNRGVISLLYALRIAIREMVYSKINIPDIHIILAEASGGNIDYSPGRGVAVVLGSSAPFASQLMVELVEDIEALIRESRSDNKESDDESIIKNLKSDESPDSNISNVVETKSDQASCSSIPTTEQQEPSYDLDNLISMHYLAIPRMFVSRGGIGTHWMLPERIDFYDPTLENKKYSTSTSYTLNKNQILRLMFALHNHLPCSNNMDFKRRVYEFDGEHDSSNEITKWKKWVCSDNHQKEWRNFVDSIKNKKTQTLTYQSSNSSRSG